MWAPHSRRKDSLFLCLSGVCGARLCQTMRQTPAVIELGQKKVMKAEEFGWEGEEAACASAGLHSQCQHTQQFCREQVSWHLQTQQPEVS